MLEIWTRRRPKSSSGAERATPVATCSTRRAERASTTPSPQRVKPGSTPSTRISLRFERCHYLIRGIKVREHVLHVIGVFEGVDELDHLACPVLIDLDQHRRHKRGLSGVVFNTGLDGKSGG